MAVCAYPVSMPAGRMCCFAFLDACNIQHALEAGCTLYHGFQGDCTNAHARDWPDMSVVYLDPELLFNTILFCLVKLCICNSI